jgi:hypothetical protein
MHDTELSEEAIRSVVLDPAFPWARVAGNRKVRTVFVKDAVEFAEQRLGARTGVEAALDQFVTSAGGRRFKLTDPWAGLGNVFRRLAGREPRAPQYLWEVPDDALSRGP